MASLHEALFSSRLQFHSSFFVSTSSSSSSLRCALPIIHNLSSPAANSCAVKSTQFLKRSSRIRLTDFPLSSASRRGFVCRAAEYKFPDPIPEFAEAIFETFLRSEYGGPGTLLVVPFTDMADTLNERELHGGPQAARAAIKWAQDHVDNDGKEWTGTD